MTFSTRNFDPLTPLAPIIPKFCYTNIAFSLETHCCRRHTCTCATEFLHHLGTGCCLPKTTFITKIGGEAGLGEHPKKFGTPYIFLQPLKLATSNLGHKLGWGLAYQKTTFRTQIGGGLGQGSIRKKCGTPYVFLQPLRLTTSNLVCNLSLGLAYQKTTFRTKIGGGLGQGSIRKNLGPPIYFCNRLKNWYATGLPCQNWRGSGPGEHPKKLLWDPLRIFATVEANNFKFGMQLGFGTSLPKNDV